MRNIRVGYRGIDVLKGLDWTVRQGEHWMVTGPNGAGKSTLLKLIYADHPQAYANDITVFGKKRGAGETIWEIRSQMGFVSPELQAAYPGDVKAFSAVCSGFYDSLGLFRRCDATQKEAAAAWGERLGIGGLMASPLNRLSNGEQRLVLIARALVKSPKLLILDEPCGGLDAGNRQRLLTLVATLGRTSPTGVIYVTQHPAERPDCITHRLHLEGSTGCAVSV